MNGHFVRSDAPTRVYWEVTRACGLACRHCRAEATPRADPRELDTAAGLRILQAFAASEPRPHIVLTEGTRSSAPTCSSSSPPRAPSGSMFRCPRARRHGSPAT